MVRYLREFTNSGSNNSSSGSSNNNTKSVLDLVNQYKFQADENTTNEEGLVVGPNGMVAVEYGANGISIRPDNDLNLDSQALSKFEQDLAQAKKLAVAISNTMK